MISAGYMLKKKKKKTLPRMYHLNVRGRLFKVLVHSGGRARRIKNLRLYIARPCVKNKILELKENVFIEFDFFPCLDYLDSWRNKT